MLYVSAAKTVSAACTLDTIHVYIKRVLRNTVGEVWYRPKPARSLLSTAETVPGIAL